MSVSAILRISAEIPLPEDMFDQSKALTKLEPTLAAFRKGLPEGSKFDARPIRARNETAPRNRKVQSADPAPEQSAQSTAPPMAEAAE